MKLITFILAGFAGLMAILALGSYFVSSSQDSRGTTVGFLVGTSIVFAVLAFISTFFNKSSPSGSRVQPNVNKKVRILSLSIIVPVVLFITILYLLAWWLGKGLTF